MNKLKILALSLLAVLCLTACSNEDNTKLLYQYYQTETYSAAAGTYVVTLNYVSGQGIVEAAEADWATVTALPNNGEEPTQVQVTLTANPDSQLRTVVQPVKAGQYTVLLTINQGATNVTNPNDEETDQPAYAPGK